MIGLDTSFLVAVTVREHAAHPEAWRLFEAEMRGRNGSYALAPQVLNEFAHIVTDQRRFERPLDMKQALAIAERWWRAGECRQVNVDERAVSIFLDWLSHHRLGRKRLLDTMLAASYKAAGVARIATTEWRDFTLFEGFEVLAVGHRSDPKP